MSIPESTNPNYVELVRFLVTPFLEFPESLTVDFETYAGNHKVLVRLAFADSDKGRVFGRGGRTLQAIRTLVETDAKLTGQQAYLEVFGEREAQAEAASSQPKVSTESRPKPRPKKPELKTTEGE